MAADRYVRTGPATPAIYPGTLKMLYEALRDVAWLSKRMPGRHCVYAVHEGQRRLLQVYEDGECTWLYKSAN